jgi:hypothetical protein
VCIEYSSGDRRAISAPGNLIIRRAGGQADPAEGGVLHQVVTELKNFVLCRGNIEGSCDLNSTWTD